ncbi:MAG: YHS domain-containing protein [Desulfatiglandaceae bacterium]
MIRLLILAFLVYLFYRVVRRYLGQGEMRDRERGQGTGAGPVDEMVQDPVCKTYIPRRDAQRKVIGGKEYFFCSKECADQFEREK